MTPNKNTHYMPQKEISEKEALLRLSALCSQAEHCSYEMEEKMRRWGMAEDERARVLGRLAELKFIDDERYARAYVRDKVKYNKWGRRKVDQGLWAKHIDEATRRRVLGEVADADYLAVLRPLLKARSRSLKAADGSEHNRKLMRFALGRGFDYRLIRQCIDVPDDMEDADGDDTVE